MRMRSIWLPAVVYANTKYELDYVVDEKTKIMVERKGVGKSMDDTFAKIEYYTVAMKILYTINVLTI